MNLEDLTNEFSELPFEEANNFDLESDLLSVDLDQDGTYESMAQGLDTDSDGQLDSWIVESDFDSDGVVDQTSVFEAVDTDDDGQIDTWTVQTDLDGDLIADEMAIASDTNDDGLPDTILSETIAASNADIVGDPASDLENWHMQTYEDTCAIASQEFILDEMTGRDFSEDELRQEAIDNGWYTPGGGTPLECTGNLLEAHGIDVDKQYGGTLEDLNGKLAEGENVIVALDSDEILNPNGIDADDMLANVAGMPEQGANHAVQVIGIDHSDPDNPVVILNDPGQPNGQGIRVDADEFVDAWQDSDRFMVSTTGKTVSGDEPSLAAFSGAGETRTLGSYADAYEHQSDADYYQGWADTYASEGDYGNASKYESWAADAQEQADAAANES